MNWGAIGTIISIASISVAVGVWVTNNTTELQEVRNQIESKTSSFVPSGAVIAFDLSSGCPKGYERFEPLSGRVIVGSGSGQGLSKRKYTDRGGQESISLTEIQLPPHRHGKGSLGVSNGGQIFHKSADGNRGGGPRTGDVFDPKYGANYGNHPHAITGETGASGNGNSFNLMQPYHVLLYCRKK